MRRRAWVWAVDGWLMVSAPVTLHWRAGPYAWVFDLAQALMHFLVDQLMQTSQNFLLHQRPHCPTCSPDSTSQHATL